ncbi:hypothetical protein Tco_1384578 [Tanacetum coccineum]
MVTESLEHVVLANESSQPQSSYEATATLTEFEFKKILIDQMDKMYTLKRSRKDKDKDEDPSAGSDRGLKKRKTSKDAEPATGPKVLVDYFLNNDLKYLQGGISTMTNTTSLTKTKAAQYDLPGIGDMVLNIWVHVKVAYDKHALWGISHWREQRKSFYGYARGLQSRHDVYSMKRILAVTQVEVMRKHGYGYLKKIIVRRADNDLYRFKEGDFPCLRINDIEDMLLLVVQNRLINLLDDDVFKFAIALRMFTRSLVIQKKIDPYTPYQDPHGFIYVENNGRNRLMRSDKLYKFSDRTITGLRISLDDITKNIQMEYLPKRKWSTLEKKRADIMIKEINKQLKERRLMKSLEKFVGGRHYGTDLRLLQRTI